MDNFMDKIAQKLSSQEVIRANAAADAAQMEKLQVQVEEYDACMKEIRKLSLKNAESEQKVLKLLDEGSGQMQKLADACLAKIQAIDEEQDKKAEVQAALEEIKKAADDNMAKLEEAFKQAEDFVHKENVKVYRNVQAAMVDELGKQTQVLENAGQAAGKNKSVLNKSVLIVGIITLVLSAVNMGLLIVHLLGGL